MLTWRSGHASWKRVNKIVETKGQKRTGENLQAGTEPERNRKLDKNRRKRICKPELNRKEK